MSAFAITRRIVHNRRHREKLGAQTQAGPLGSVRVNQKAHPIVLDNELESAAGAGKAREVSDHQDVGPAQPVLNFGKAPTLGRTDENHLTAPGLRGILKARESDWVAPDHPMLKGIVKGPPKGIRA